MKTGLQNAEARIASDGDTAPPRDTSSSNSPPRAGAGAGGLADAMRNLGGAGGMPDLAGLMNNLPGAGAGTGAGAGGMPDLAGMMNNPAMMQMAQQMMANGGLERLMSNPAVANMVSYFKSDVYLT